VNTSAMTTQTLQNKHMDFMTFLSATSKLFLKLFLKRFKMFSKVYEARKITVKTFCDAVPDPIRPRHTSYVPRRVISVFNANYAGHVLEFCVCFSAVWSVRLILHAFFIHACTNCNRIFLKAAQHCNIPGKHSQ